MISTYRKYSPSSTLEHPEAYGMIPSEALITALRVSRESQTLAEQALLMKLRASAIRRSVIQRYVVRVEKKLTRAILIIKQYWRNLER